MKLNRSNITNYLNNFDFEALFIEELGWDYPQDNSDKYITVNEQIFPLTPIADKRGFKVFLCLLENQSIPLSTTLKKIDQEISKYSYEHFIIYASQLDKNQKWQWVKKEANQPLAHRTVEYSQHKKEALLQILDTIYIDLEEEDNLSLLEVKSKAKKAFDLDKVTKKFYDKFKKEHSQFLGFIEGITVDFDKKWYASLMLNRLMFVYFIQKKGFLNSDLNYLRNKLTEITKMNIVGANAPSPLPKKDVNFYSFYRYFLLRLFHDGLGSQNHTPELEQLLGKVPYLNGGLFEIHPLENKYPKIEIKDEAFEKIFTFFDQYNWHLDERPLKSDNEINPDVLGYIFEKYINQKQMGAYYTKEDITDYISKNCIIPYLFDSVNQVLLGYLSAEEVNHNLGFYLLSDNPDRYIYDAVKKGADLPLPDDIAKGINDVSQRENWNLPADESYALPTEIWREFIARRNRCIEVREKLTNGEITSINDLITYNLNIRQFAQDAISGINSPLTLKIFYEKLSTMSILDPTCGSGAFLFAALNILEPLYDACLERMQIFIDEETSLKLDSKEKKYLKEFQGILANVISHANRKYFILINIILNNLFGVDIMEEATEICKLRLFLKLASQVTPDPNRKNYGIEPLPDIDFNIRWGNSLVGFANYNEVEKAVKGDAQPKLDLFDDMAVINDKAKAVSEVYQTFRSIQTQTDGANFTETKQKLQVKLASLNDELNQYLAREYGVDINKKKEFENWLISHQPFHWFTEFYSIINHGGFDVIIGNPPYVEYRKLNYSIKENHYQVNFKLDIYSAIIERSVVIMKKQGNLSMIVPISIFSTKGFISLQNLLIEKFNNIWCSNFAITCNLFEGITKRLSIIILSNNKDKLFCQTKYYKNKFDNNLFSIIKYQNLNQYYYTVEGAVPKISDIRENSILSKIFSENNKLIESLSNREKKALYFTRALGNFCVFHNEKPFSLDENNNKVYASEIIEVRYYEDYYWQILAIFNSNLFGWFYNVFSDMRHINKGINNSFMIPLSLKKINLEKLLLQLMTSYEDNASLRKLNASGIRKKCYQPRLSKPIIDKIDKILAEHYGFTDEELDFIINYDIKYRMGKELGEED